MAFKSWPGLITAGDPETTIYTCPANAEGSIHGIVMAAAAAGTASPVLTMYKQSMGTGVDMPCDPVDYGTSYAFLKPINMEAGDYLTISVTGVDLHVLASIYEDGAVASAGTFNPRGAYSAPATYDKLDLVESAGATWICMSDGVTGDAPPSVNWMQAVAAPTGTLLAFNNLTDVDDPAAALAAIGGATAVHQHVKADITDFNDGDYATAAQGTKADAARPSKEAPQVLTADHTAAHGELLVLGAGALTVTLPASPQTGHWVSISNVSGATDNVIARGASNIMSVAEDLVFDVAYGAVRLVYADAANGWVFD